MYLIRNRCTLRDNCVAATQLSVFLFVSPLLANCFGFSLWHNNQVLLFTGRIHFWGWKHLRSSWMLSSLLIHVHAQQNTHNVMHSWRWALKTRLIQIYVLHSFHASVVSVQSKNTDLKFFISESLQTFLLHKSLGPLCYALIFRNPGVITTGLLIPFM